MTTINVKELKQNARAALMGKHGFFAGMVLIVAACNLGLSYLTDSAVPFTGTWLSLILYFVCSILTNMVYYIILAGYMNLYLNLCRNRKLQFQDLWLAFSNHPEHIAAYSVIQFILHSILSNGGYWVIAKILKASGFSEIIPLLLGAAGAGLLILWIQLALSMVLFLYCDAPYKRPQELIRDSIQMTRGRRKTLLYLYFSFLGLMFLSLLSFGFGTMFTYPYLYTTLCLFYLNTHRSLDM